MSPSAQRALSVLVGFILAVVLAVLLDVDTANAQMATSTGGVRIIPTGNIDVRSICNDPELPWLEWEVVGRDNEIIPYEWYVIDTGEKGAGKVKNGEVAVIQTGRADVPGQTVLHVKWGGVEWHTSSWFRSSASIGENLGCFPTEETLGAIAPESSVEAQVLSLQKQVAGLLEQLRQLIRSLAR